MQTLCKSEVEHQAKARYGSTAKVFPYIQRLDGVATEWHGLAVGGKVIGFRRELSELLGLVQRGSVMRIINGTMGQHGSNARDYQSRVRENSANVVPG